MNTKKWFSAFAVIVILSFCDTEKLLNLTIEEVHAATSKDTPLLRPPQSAVCKKNCATQQTACSGGCRGLEPQLEICKEKCAKAFEECVKKCDQMPTSMLDLPENPVQTLLVPK